MKITSDGAAASFYEQGSSSELIGYCPFCDGLSDFVSVGQRAMPGEIVTVCCLICKHEHEVLVIDSRADYEDELARDYRE